MRIDTLYLKNFRGFEQKEISFHPRFSVIAGENGSGKTSILEGLCVALGGWLFEFGGLDGSDKRNIVSGDCRTILAKVNTAPLPQLPVEVRANAELDGRHIEWSRSITKENGHTSYGGLKELREIAKKCNDMVYAGEDTDLVLPIVAYYSAARLWNEPLQREKRIKRDEVRLAAYRKTLQSANSVKDTMNEIERIAFLAYSEGDQVSLNEMDAIIDALNVCISATSYCGNVKYSRKLAQFYVENDCGESIPYERLSDGYRCMISLIVDVCRRMIMLNPQLGADAIKQTSGIILIDEIDLHLHPKWQKSVVSDLKAIFPNVQFVATTHSPFIIQSLQDGELISLSNMDANVEYSGESIEDIAEDVLGLSNPQYSKEKVEMYERAHDFYEKLDAATTDDDLSAVRERFDLLTAKYSGDVAYLAFLEQKMLKKQVKLEVDNETCE